MEGKIIIENLHPVDEYEMMGKHGLIDLASRLKEDLAQKYMIIADVKVI